MKKYNVAFIFAKAIGLSLSIVTASVSAQNTTAELTTEWYKWQQVNYPSFGFGDGMVDCALGQRGNIWFLGGSGGTTSVRECMESIPAGKQLFFPLINTVVWDEPLNTAERRQLLNEVFSDQFPGVFNSEACNLTATLDGEPVIFSGTPIERVQSPLFNYLDDSEAVADGFWVLLPKLGRGDHTLNFTGSFCMIGTNTSIGFDVNVTYDFTIH